MWYVLERLSDGGWGETMAPMGNDISEVLRRRSRREPVADAVPEATDACMERADAAREMARMAGEGGGRVRFGVEPTLEAFWSAEPGRE